MTPDTSRTERETAPALVLAVLLLAASCSRSDAHSQAIGMIEDGADGDVATIVDSAVKRTDYPIWDDREHNLRRVHVAISIPPGRDHVVIDLGRGIPRRAMANWSYSM